MTWRQWLADRLYILAGRIDPPEVRTWRAPRDLEDSWEDVHGDNPL